MYLGTVDIGVFVQVTCHSGRAAPSSCHRLRIDAKLRGDFRHYCFAARHTFINRGVAGHCFSMETRARIAALGALALRKQGTMHSTTGSASTQNDGRQSAVRAPATNTRTLRTATASQNVNIRPSPVWVKSTKVSDISPAIIRAIEEPLNRAWTSARPAVFGSRQTGPSPARNRRRRQNRRERIAENCCFH
ncbi:MAG: hypothetical protein GPOALKHO_000567 [Sodalis sp.]|nr:MAG: hypothetical protein GPOALKHO_000567 [Sodalis sp.]